MLLHLLIPLDGSPLAERALEMAVFLARRTMLTLPAYEPRITLFRAIDPSPWLDLTGGGARTQAMEAATRYLEAQAEGLLKEGLTVEKVARLGQPAVELLEQAQARHVDLIIMSTHGRSGMARWALGSVAERVARSAPVPVLLLPVAAPAALIPQDAPGGISIARILVPLDRSARSEAALPPALELARLLQAEVWLFCVLMPRFEEETGGELQRPWEAARFRLHEVEQYLQRHAEAAKQAGVIARWSLGSGLPGAKIITHAHTHQMQLIVMTTQGRGGLVRWRLGSVAEEVIHRGQLPVLLVPSGAATTDQSKEGCSPSIVASAQEGDRPAPQESKG